MERKSPIGGPPSPLVRPSRPSGWRPGEPIPSATTQPGAPFYLRPIPVNTRSVVDHMRGVLNAEEPRFARILYSTWNAAAEPLKYQEIRNAMRTGEISSDILEQWRQDYSRMINDRFGPRYDAIARAANSSLSAGIAQVAGTGVRYAETAVRMNVWIRQHGARLAVALTDEQRTAVQTVLRHFIVNEPIGARELGRYLRPVVGMTPRQAQAVVNLRERLVAEGLSGDTLINRVEAYSGYLQRVRAERIARTEAAFAHNQADIETMRSALDSGVITGTPIKALLPAEDERTCWHCAPLADIWIGLEETFPGATDAHPNVIMPPLHPNCRCAVLFGFDGD